MATGLRILHVVPAIAPRYGGPSTATLGMCRALRAAGIDAVIATTDADGPGRLDVPTGRHTEIGDVPAYVFPRRGSERFKWSPELGRWLRSNVERFDVTHVHAVFSYSTVAAGRACARAGVPYLVRPLGTLDPWCLAHHPRRKRALLALGLRRVLGQSARMHYTTEDERQLAESATPGLPKGIVVPLGLDDAWFSREPEAARDATIVVVARLDPKKRIDLALAAFHRIVGSGRLPEYRLVIAGTGSPACETALRRVAAQGPAAERIRFAGWVSGRDRAALLGRARLFLMPSHQESFGVAAVEAMACGTPVIVSPGVNLGSAIIDAGAGWIAPIDEVALADAIVAALADDAVWVRQAAAARRFAARFRWASVASQLTEVYGSIAR